MKTKAQQLYVHQKTGTVVSATKQQAKKLPGDFKKVEFITKDGKPTARVRIDGATIDIAETEAPQHVNASAK
jgi:RNase P/RNase MRP subunit p29